ATIHEGAPARHISHDGDEFQVTACTAAGDSLTFLSSHLINAAGAWANEIARQFGEPAPMAPRAPQMAESEPLPALISPVLGCVSGAVYLRQAADGRIFFGGGYGRLLDDGENAEPVEQTSRATLAAALRLAPALKDMKVRRAWSGVEGYMEDGVQVLGPSATTDGLLHGFGFSGHGFQIGPAAGAVLADLVLSGRSTTPIDAFAITRFAAAS
ncbi:MAG: FAD-binding oxidoreductase, partial [Alphaproteobacteria bacterium]